GAEGGRAVPTQGTLQVKIFSQGIIDPAIERDQAQGVQSGIAVVGAVEIPNSKVIVAQGVRNEPLVAAHKGIVQLVLLPGIPCHDFYAMISGGIVVSDKIFKDFFDVFDGGSGAIAVKSLYHLRASVQILARADVLILIRDTQGVAKVVHRLEV